MDLAYWMPVMLGGAVAGGSTGTLGVYIVGMRIPFLGVCVAHAALAGAVFGALLGVTGQWLLAPALAGAILTAMLLGLLGGEKLKADTNVMLGVLFSLTMGLAFLGIGMFNALGVPDDDVRSLLWGSLNFCRWKDVKLMAAAAGLTFAFVALLYKELQAMMFSRLHASAAGVPVTVVWTGLLVLTSVVLTVNFQTVGGLLIYSLMSNPATAAFQLVKGHRNALLLAALLGAISGLGGFLIAAWLDLPTGAMIVIFSSTLVAAAALIRLVRDRL